MPSGSASIQASEQRSLDVSVLRKQPQAILAAGHIGQGRRQQAEGQVAVQGHQQQYGAPAACHQGKVLQAQGTEAPEGAVGQGSCLQLLHQVGLLDEDLRVKHCLGQQHAQPEAAVLQHAGEGLGHEGWACHVEGGAGGAQGASIGVGPASAPWQGPCHAPPPPRSPGPAGPSWAGTAGRGRRRAAGPLPGQRTAGALQQQPRRQGQWPGRGRWRGTAARQPRPSRRATGLLLRGCRGGGAGWRRCQGWQGWGRARRSCSHGQRPAPAAAAGPGRG